MERAETTVLVSPLLFKLQHSAQLFEKPSGPECAASDVLGQLWQLGSRLYQFTDLTECVDLVGVWVGGCVVVVGANALLCV